MITTNTVMVKFVFLKHSVVAPATINGTEGKKIYQFKLSFPPPFQNFWNCHCNVLVSNITFLIFAVFDV